MKIRGRRCDHCGKDARYGFEDRCRACWFPVAQWAPNVQLASVDTQTTALDERFLKSRSIANSTGALAPLESLLASGRRSAVVVNMPEGIASDLLENERTLYAPYAQLVHASVRAPAAFEDDRRRLAVDSIIYGKYGEQIVFGALSLDGWGPSSYGEAHAELLESTIAYRSSVLEENSYSFVQKHNLVAGMELPVGFLASWDQRDKLIVCKVSSQLMASPQVDPSQLIMSSDGNRAAETFLEVHTYGTFNRQAISKIRLRKLKPAGTTDDKIRVLQRQLLRERAAEASMELAEA
jgi:hypothetical protein